MQSGRCPHLERREGFLYMAAAAELTQTEQLRSFDPLASVDLYQFDLQMYGRILPETEQRVYDEELTYIAEGVNRPLYTQFTLRQQGGELQYFDRGKWTPYLATLERGKLTAEQEALMDERKRFAAERTADDLLHGYTMRGLAPGETAAWASPFPEAECQRYGEAFVSSLGYQPKRRMGFLYFAERLETGEVVLHTQSVDNSDPEAFEAALTMSRGGITAMRERYDEVLGRKRGGRYFAGRPEGADSQQNAWEVIRQHTDLLEYYFKEIRQLAGQTALPRAEREVAKKRLTYGVWAALKERIDKGSVGVRRVATGSFAHDHDQAIRHEVHSAYQELSKRGEKLFGCGGAIGGEEALLGAEAEDVSKAIFGGKNEVLKCVTCPLCKRSGVDAHIKHSSNSKTITCSKCRQSKTYSK